VFRAGGKVVEFVNELIGKSGGKWNIKGGPAMSQVTKPFESTVHGLKDSIELLLLGSSGQLKYDISKVLNEATLIITSTHPNRARIEITLDGDFGAYLKIGKGSIFEIPFEGKRYSQPGFRDDVTTLIAAVIRNGFQEDVLVSKGLVVGASGTIRGGGPLPADAKESWRKIGWDLFSKPEREHHTYLPY
jgi:hypothetical protein